MEVGQTSGMSWCTKYLFPVLSLYVRSLKRGIVRFLKTLKRGLFLAFCYTLVCLLYVSLYYTEPHSNNYGYDENIDRKSLENAESNKNSKDNTDDTNGDQLMLLQKAPIKEVEPVTEVGTAPPEIDFVRDVLGNKVLKPNSTGMPWVNYRSILTNQSISTHCSSCAIVSSSGQLLGSKAGKEIDRHDCVIRMNDAPVKGFESDVGYRTSIRVVGHTNIKKSFGVDEDLQKQLFADPTSRTERVVVHFFQRTEFEGVGEFDSIKELATKYPRTKFDYFTSEKMKFSERLFLQETGISRAQARTWFSTGWFAMLYAIDTCESIDMYGMVYENYCDEHPDEKTPYHYYDPSSRTECGYYRVSEVRLTGGHLFITEKAIFAQWSRLYRINFYYPEWKKSRRIGIKSLKTPFLQRYETAGHRLFSRYPWWKLFFHFSGIFYPLVH